MFTCFLQADQVLCRDLGRHKFRNHHRNDWICWVTSASLEHSKNLLASMSTCEYVAHSAWELLAKPTSYDLCSLWICHWNGAGSCQVWTQVAPSCSSMGSSHGWLWLQGLCHVWPLHRTGIHSDFTITILICIAEISDFLSIQLQIKWNSSSILGVGVQEAKKVTEWRKISTTLSLLRQDGNNDDSNSEGKKANFIKN